MSVESAQHRAHNILELVDSKIAAPCSLGAFSAVEAYSDVRDLSR